MADQGAQDVVEMFLHDPAPELQAFGQWLKANASAEEIAANQRGFEAMSQGKPVDPEDFAVCMEMMKRLPAELRNAAAFVLAMTAPGARRDD